MKLSALLQKLLLATLLISYSSFAQEGQAIRKNDYRNPLDLPVSLSGNYGELRATHFHAGIDLRVGGVVGARVHSAYDGYVSRISVSPTGYGNAVYIEHPNGRTTLYGHLHDFSPELAKWVREEQYKRESFAVNLYPLNEMFPVKRGTFIGRAGNSGSSGGPHLHYEIRESSSQIPLNPVIEGGIKVIDGMPPVIHRVNIYSISSHSTLPQRSLIKSITDNFQNTVEVSDTFYIAVHATDKKEGTNARLAVSNYSYFLNDSLIFSFTPNRIPFDQGRYINSVVEYGEKVRLGISMIKSWQEPGGGLKNNIKAVNEGLFILRDNGTHIVKVALTDEHGNITKREIKVRRGLAIQRDTLSQDSSQVMPWFLPNYYHNNDMRIMLPPGSLYSSIIFNSSVYEKDGRRIWSIHSPYIPIHNTGRVSLKAEIPEELREKAVIVTVGEKGEMRYIGGAYNQGWIESPLLGFGNYSVTFDTIPPVINPQFREGENLAGRSHLRITIHDNLSGIARYSAYIDDKWILASYDPKNRRLEVELKPDKIERGKRHIVVIEVEDNRGNINMLKRSFIW